MKNSLHHVMILLGCFMVFSCRPGVREQVEVDFDPVQAGEAATLKNDTIPVIRVAIATVISPRESFAYYQDIFEAMSEKLGRRIEFKQRSTYEEVNEMLAQNQVDIAFVCAGAYIVSEQCELLVVPVVQGRPHYRAYIIAHKDSPVNSFEDFKGRSFTYSDPLCFTGKLYVDNRLLALGTDAASFFSEIQYSMAHDISIQMVARSVVDGASVNGLIFEYMKVYHPEFTNQVKVIEMSGYHGIPPVVHAKGLPDTLKKEIQDFFLGMHASEREKSLLDRLLIDRFILAGDTLYDGLRKARLMQQQDSR